MKKKSFLKGLLKGKKQEGCCESADANSQEIETKPGLLAIEILGSGCKNCNILASNTEEALKQLNLEASIQKVTDFVDIAKYGVMSTPALVVNGKVVSFGKVSSVSEIVEILK